MKNTNLLYNVKLIVLFFLSPFLLIRCNLPSNPEDSLISISFTENSINISIGEEKQLQLITEPSGLGINNITWSSSDERIVTVDNSGLVHAISNGTATVLAVSSKGLSTMCNVIVAAPSAYDSLSKNEKYFFDVFIKKINKFKDPSSVRIVGFSVCPKYGENSTSFTVTAKNSLGGTVQKHYLLALKNYTYEPSPGWGSKYQKGDLNGLSSNQGLWSDGWCEDVSVQRINLAIKEYVENKGF